MSLIFYSVIIAVFAVCIALYSFHSTRLNLPQIVAEDAGEYVILRKSSFSRLIRSMNLSVKKAHISKLQIARNCLTLFTKSDNAYDIWLSSKHINATFSHLKSLLPNAEIIEI